MKKIVSVLITLIMVTEIAFGHIIEVTIGGFGGGSSNRQGNVVQIIPKVDIESWDVKSGNVTVTDNQFTIPGADVYIEGKIPEPIPLSEIPIGAYIAYKPVYNENGVEVTTATVLGTDAGTLDTDNVTGIDQTFDFNNYTGGWKVMYNDGNQLTLIAAESVGDLTLGTIKYNVTSETAPELNGGKIGYAKAIYTLNKLCNDYAKGEYAVSGRCLGQGNGPYNLLEEGIELDDITNTNIQELRRAVENPLTAPYYPYGDSYNSNETDYIKNTLIDGSYKLRHSVGDVWIASREIDTYASATYFCLRRMDNVGDVYANSLINSGSAGDMAGVSHKRGVRPIITLESGVNIVGGDGLTPETAYQLAWGTPTSYIVSYNANGGSGAPRSQTKISGTALTLSNTVPTRDGYAFLGWSTDSSSAEAEYSAGSSFKDNKNTVLYAVWEVETIPLSEIPIGAYIAYNPVYEENGQQVTTATVLGTDSGKLDTDNVTGLNQTFQLGGHAWKVMYNDGNQLTLIAAESIGDLTLGRDAAASSETEPKLNGGKIGYAKAIYTLNKLCNDYAKGEYAVSGRCPGYSNGPDNLLEEGIDLDDITHTNLRGLINDTSNPLTDPYYPFGDNYNKTETDYITNTTDADGNYVLRHSSGYVWLASRYVGSDSSDSYFRVRYLDSTGYVGYGALYSRLSGGASYGSAGQRGVRPIITLESGIKVVKGEQDGKTAETAYILTK